MSLAGPFTCCRVRHSHQTDGPSPSICVGRSALSLKVSVDVSHERALESHQVNGAPGNVVRYALDPADQNVFVPAIHDQGREPAMVEVKRPGFSGGSMV